MGNTEHSSDKRKCIERMFSKFLTIVCSGILMFDLSEIDLTWLFTIAGYLWTQDISGIYLQVYRVVAPVYKLNASRKLCFLVAVIVL